MKLPNMSGCSFPGMGGNGCYTTITDYDSRRTGNGLLDTGSTPVYSTPAAGITDILICDSCFFFIPSKKDSWPVSLQSRILFLL